MTTEPKRLPLPYYDPFPALLRRAGQELGIIVRFGRHGVYIVQRPSDVTMAMIGKKAQ